MKKKLTADFVKALLPREKAYEIRDTELTGLICRVQPTGLRVFYLQYRDAQDNTKRLKLGRYPTLNVATARTKAKAELARVTLGASPAEEKAQVRRDLTLKEFLDQHYADWAAANLKSHGTAVPRIRSGFADLLDTKLASLDTLTFERHRQQRLKVKLDGANRIAGATTVNRDQATLRAALSKAVQWGMLESNPLIGVKTAREDRNAKIRALTFEEEKKIMDTFEKRRKQAQDERAEKNKERAERGKRPLPPLPHFQSYLEPMILLALDSGARRGELLSLTWSNLDLDGGMLTVAGAQAKSSQSREIPLTSRAVSILRQWKAQTGGQNAELVFPSPFGGGQIEYIKTAWANLLKEAEVPRLRFHDLRHTNGSRLAQAGVPVVVIQKLLGHANLATSSRYMHATGTDTLNAIALLEQARAAQK